MHKVVAILVSLVFIAGTIGNHVYTADVKSYDFGSVGLAIYLVSILSLTLLSLLGSYLFFTRPLPADKIFLYCLPIISQVCWFFVITLSLLLGINPLDALRNYYFVPFVTSFYSINHYKLSRYGQPFIPLLYSLLFAFILILPSIPFVFEHVLRNALFSLSSLSSQLKTYYYNSSLLFVPFFLVPFDRQFRILVRSCIRRSIFRPINLFLVLVPFLAIIVGPVFYLSRSYIAILSVLVFVSLIGVFNWVAKGLRIRNLSLLLSLASTVLLLVFYPFISQVLDISEFVGRSDVVRLSSRDIQLTALLSDLDFFGNGLGSSLKGFDGSAGMHYAVELTYLGIIHKYGIFSIPILSFLLYPLAFSFRNIFQPSMRGRSLVVFSMSAYIFASFANPSIGSPWALLMTVFAFSYAYEYPVCNAGPGSCQE